MGEVAVISRICNIRNGARYDQGQGCYQSL